MWDDAKDHVNGKLKKFWKEMYNIEMDINYIVNL